ncbi:MAG: hypothetical protein K2V38_02705 [Gemmataceae bacterium]|nr:hypothetical protein [Gemmataceae bacterium]
MGADDRPNEHLLVGTESFDAGTQATRVEGLMAIARSLRASQINPANHILYIDLLEVAPTNISCDARPRRFAWVGQLLLHTAVWLSRAQGAGGAVALHSLPQAEDFYRRHGLIDLGFDPSVYEGQLRYFELDTNAAADIYARGWAV